MLPFSRVAIIGMGLIGSSLARAIRETMPTVAITGRRRRKSICSSGI